LPEGNSMTSAEAAAWAALGPQLRKRRAQVDPRYMSRTLFAAERRINPRLAADIEKGRRQNFDRATLAAIEVAYMLQPDAIDRYITGTAQELEVAPAPVLSERAAALPVPSSPEPQRLLHLYDKRLDPYLFDVELEFEDAVAEFGPGLTGEQAFPGNRTEAKAWNGVARGILTEEEALREIARLRWLRKQRAARVAEDSGGGRESALAHGRDVPSCSHLVTLRRSCHGLLVVSSSHVENRICAPHGCPGGSGALAAQRPRTPGVPGTATWALGGP